MLDIYVNLCMFLNAHIAFLTIQLRSWLRKEYVQVVSRASSQSYYLLPLKNYFKQRLKPMYYFAYGPSSFTIAIAMISRILAVIFQCHTLL